MKHRPPLFLGLKIDEVLGIEKTGGVGPIVRPAHLRHNLLYLGERRQHQTRLIHDPCPFGRSRARRQCPAGPNRSFIEMGQKFRTHDPAHQQDERGQNHHSRRAECQMTMRQRPPHAAPVLSPQEFHDRVGPLRDALPKNNLGENGPDHNRENQRTEQCERNGPRHRLEQTPFDALQREDGHIGCNDDGAGKEHRPQHLEHRSPNSLKRRLDRIALEIVVPDDILDHHHGAVDDHSKIKRAQGQQVRRNLVQIQANRRKQQRKRDRQRYDERPANVSEEEEQDDRNQQHACGQVMQNRVGGEVHQIAPVQERHNPHARRQNLLVQLLHLHVNILDHRIGVRTLP